MGSDPTAGTCCRAGDLGFRQCYTPGRNIHTPNLPPPYFLVACCLCAPSRDLQSTWHATASRESQDNFPPSPRLAPLQTLLLLPLRPQFPGCNQQSRCQGCPLRPAQPPCRVGACLGRSRALGDVYSGWLLPRKGAQQPRSVRAEGEQSWGSPTALGSPGQSHTLQGRHSTNTAPVLPQGCRQHLRSGGNHQSSKKSKPPVPTHCQPDPREPESLRLQSPGVLWAQFPWDQPRSCLLCQHSHPTAHLSKPTSTGAVPALGQGPKHGHSSQHTPCAWGSTGHPVGAVTSQPRPCTQTGHIQHLWPETPEKAPQLMMMAEPFQGAEINSTLHRSCAGRGGERRASSSRVT